MLPRRTILSSFLFAAACTAAFADQPVAGPPPPPPQIALGIAPARFRAPYEVQILCENGEMLPTYHQRDRYYVQGNLNERYIIRIANPTSQRIEAVVTVDGLDVIDGDNGDLRKRGYVVPAYGETRIEGFRTSTSDVATFRFSSVGGSYAGQKGKARNVGVIAVALFAEREPDPDQRIILGDRPPPPPRPHPRPYDDRRDLDDHARPASGASKRGYAEPEAGKAAEAPAAVAPAPAAPAGANRSQPSADDEAGVALPGRQPSRERLGLGTEFGEQRYSSVSYTRFMRAPGRPVAIAELRYNDAVGLMALGIPVAPRPDDGEIMTRETADPFPGDRFAQPPP